MCANPARLTGPPRFEETRPVEDPGCRGLSPRPGCPPGTRGLRLFPRDLRSRGESPRHPVHGPPRALRAPHGERVPGEAPRVPYGNSGFGSEGGPPVFLRNTGTRALSARGRGKSLDQNQLVFSTSQLKPLLTVDLTPIKRVIFPRPNGEHSS